MPRVRMYVYAVVLTHAARHNILGSMATAVSVKGGGCERVLKWAESSASTTKLLKLIVTSAIY